MHARIGSVGWVIAIACTAMGCGTTGDRTSGSAEGGGASAEDTGIASATDGASGSASASASGSASASAEGGTGAESAGGEAPPVVWDLGAIPDVPGDGGCDPGGGGGGGGEPDFSFIWVANSTQGTVSKINTQTLEEEARYRVRPDSAGSPSRTSVSLNGDVAVANRSGGVTKIYARELDCPDPANTSHSGAEILAWQDGCIAWYTPFAYMSQRPVAWAPGDWNPVDCKYDNEKLWTSGSPEGQTIEVLLLDGETGVVEQTIPIPGVQAGYYGIYGGASDADGNFWGSQLGGGQLVRVDRQDFTFETWQTPAGGYGMTVDENGRAWTCSSQAARFDYATESWQVQPMAGGNGGCMADGNGKIWLGGYTANYTGGQLSALDIETLDQVQVIPIPSYAHGVSIDFYGYVWGVSMDTRAYRVDPNTEVIDTFDGLVGPYTYSDMTGWALSNVVGPPPSG
jgi:hypothetical protein